MKQGHFDQRYQHVAGDQINVGHDINMYIPPDLALLVQVNAAHAQDLANPGSIPGAYGPFPSPNNAFFGSPYMPHHGHHNTHHHHNHHSSYDCTDTSQL